MNLRRILAGLALACAGLAHAQFGVSTSGSITTQNLVATGAATASSCVAMDITNKGTVAAQVSGTYTGALSAQRTADGATWETLSASTTFTNVAGTQTATIGSGTTGTFAIVNVAGFRSVRVCGLAAVTGTATVVIYTAIPGGGSAGSSGGGGGGDASAANQVTANTKLDTINTSINTASTQMVSAMGTLATANSASVTFSTSDAGPVAPAAATATRGIVPVATYNTTPTTRTNTQQGGLEADANGNLRVVEPDLLLGPYVSSADGVLFDIDTTGYESIAVHTTTAGSGTHTFTTSNLQAATYVATVGYAPGSSGSTIAVGTIASAASMLLFPKTGRFFKDTISGYGGASTIYVLLSKKPVGSQIQAYISNGGFQTQGSAIGTVGLLQVCDARTSITAVATAQGAREVCTLEGKKTVLPYAIPELTWQYAAAASGIASSTTAVVMKSATASLRNYITACTLDHDALSAAAEVVIEDGAAAVLWRGKLQTTAVEGRSLPFPVPLAPPANSNASVRLLSSVTGGVYMSCQGYQAP